MKPYRLALLGARHGLNSSLHHGACSARISLARRALPVQPTEQIRSKSRKPRPIIDSAQFNHSWWSEHAEAGWPAPADQFERAREVIQECANAQKKTLIVPSKGPDGLSAGAILQKTLVFLDLAPELISVHFLEEGRSIHDEEERAAMAAHEPEYIFVLDQFFREAQPLIDAPHKAVVINPTLRAPIGDESPREVAVDDSFPSDAVRVKASNSGPMVTGSFLMYSLCMPLHTQVMWEGGWLCVVGSQQELGDALTWEPPLPKMKSIVKSLTQNNLSRALMCVSIPRWAPLSDFYATWDSLTAANHPADLSKNRPLLVSRDELEDGLEGEPQIHAQTKSRLKTNIIPPEPLISADGTIAIVQNKTPNQALHHATRILTEHLEVPSLKIVLVHQDHPTKGIVSYLCRVAKTANHFMPPSDIDAILRAAAERSSDPTLLYRLRYSFGHVRMNLNSGVVSREAFQELMEALGMRSSRK